MEIINNDKKFYILKIHRITLLYIDSPGICDSCNSTPAKGYYIAVLNHWYCQACYDEWYKYAKNYPSDREYETTNFKNMIIAVKKKFFKKLSNIFQGFPDWDALENTVQKTFKAGLKFSTMNTPDMGYETAIEDAKNIYIVERYRTEDEALNGHIKWVLLAEKLDVIQPIDEIFLNSLTSVKLIRYNDE